MSLKICTLIFWSYIATIGECLINSPHLRNHHSQTHTYYNNDPYYNNSRSGGSLIVAIIVSSLAGVCCFFCILYVLRWRRTRNQPQYDQNGQPVQSGGLPIPGFLQNMMGGNRNNQNASAQGYNGQTYPSGNNQENDYNRGYQVYDHNQGNYGNNQGTHNPSQNGPNNQYPSLY